MSSQNEFRVYSIGNNNPIGTIDFLNALVVALKENNLLYDKFNTSDYIEFSEA